MDFIINGKAHGSLASVLLHNNFDVRPLRPFIGADGRSYQDRLAENGSVVTELASNAATLRKDEWIQLDQQILKVARSRLKLVSDLTGAGLVYTIPNGMGKTVLQSESQSDTNDAEVSMDGLKETVNDRPHIDIVSLPLPIVSKDFSFSARQLAASRNGGTPLDTSMAEQAARKVAEKIEKMAIGGSAETYSSGGASVYGLLTFPSRLTHTILAPTDGAWTPTTLINQVIAMRTKSQVAKFYGPWKLYLGLAWEDYLDRDYSTASVFYPTLRERLQKIGGISGVETLDYMPTFNIALVQQTTDVIRIVNGMEIVTLQWESKGGLQLNFKVMGIKVPQIRADFNGNTGLVHGNV